MTKEDRIKQEIKMIPRSISRKGQYYAQLLQSIKAKHSSGGTQ